MIEITDEEYAEMARIADIARKIADNPRALREALTFAEPDRDPFWFAREEGVEED